MTTDDLIDAYLVARSQGKTDVADALWAAAQGDPDTDTGSDE